MNSDWLIRSAYNLILVSTLLIMATGGCSRKEKVVKPLRTIAKQNEGHYDVESFLIDGKPPVAGMSRIAGEEVAITLKFRRNRDFPVRGILYASVVFEIKENELFAEGSQMEINHVKIPNRADKRFQTVTVSLTIPDIEANSILVNEQILGRYCKIIIYESRSEIVSQKILIAHE